MLSLPGSTTECEQRASRQVRQIGDEFVELMVEMEGMRNEYRRWQAVERAIDVERDPDALLN